LNITPRYSNEGPVKKRGRKKRRGHYLHYAPSCRRGKAGREKKKKGGKSPYFLLEALAVSRTRQGEKKMEGGRGKRGRGRERGGPAGEDDSLSWSRPGKPSGEKGKKTLFVGPILLLIAAGTRGGKGRKRKGS